jgi:broad specificity phosphatase PhoE
MQLFTAALAAAFVLAGAAQAQTVVLVRHAEKAAEPAADPGLTPEGEARAQALAAALKGARVSAILTSPLQRTVRTAAPLAAAAGVQSRPVALAGGTEAHVAAVAALARAAPADATVVVVGHSNTVPLIAQALGSTSAEAIPDCRYDGLWVVRLGPQPAAVSARYGAPSTGC